jgi:6-pyruvoyltetrahydropterin/6-carboxytetrahydropterin synthase
VIEATRRIGIDAGHRVTRHESKCRHVHGHRYEVEVTVVAPELDNAGRVVDFGRLKEVVGGWLLEKLDHGYIAAPWDGVADHLEAQGLKVYRMPLTQEPTAENIAAHVLEVAQYLLGEPFTVTRVRVYETPNCWADATPGRP